MNCLEKIVCEVDVLTEPDFCKYCNAKKMQYEPKGFCCCDGQILLVDSKMPNELYDLFTADTIEGKKFRTYVRTYNNTFGFTSFGVKYDKDLCKKNKGIYVFRVQGQVYHYIHELIPQSDKQPSYLQLYFYDTEHELENRLRCSNVMNVNILEKLIKILEVNPYVKFFRSLKDISNLEELFILIKSDTSLDQRVYNAPVASQVAAVWVEDNMNPNGRCREIVVNSHSGYSHKVEYYFSCYDSLQYPLMFPFGDTGWHQRIRKIDKHKRQFYCERQFMIDPNKMASVAEMLDKETEGMWPVQDLFRFVFIVGGFFIYL